MPDKVKILYIQPEGLITGPAISLTNLLKANARKGEVIYGELLRQYHPCRPAVEALGQSV